MTLTEIPVMPAAKPSKPYFVGGDPPPHPAEVNLPKVRPTAPSNLGEEVLPLPPSPSVPNWTNGAPPVSSDAS